MGKGEMRRVRLAAPVVIALALAGACSDDTTSEEGTAGSTTTAAPSASSSTTATDTADEGSTIEIVDPWCRSNPPMAGRTACYFTAKNNGETDDAIVKASVATEVAGVVELHETVPVSEAGGMDEAMAEHMGGGMDEGMSSTTMGEHMSSDTTMGGGMTMRPVESIPLPAGGEAELKPGGLHVMLLELVDPLEEGSTIALTLELESGETIEVDAEVRAA